MSDLAVAQQRHATRPRIALLSSARLECLFRLVPPGQFQRYVAYGDGQLKKSLKQRIEEAIREEISIAPYDPEWPNLYENEAVSLRGKLPQSVVIKIEHFGSTAVPGLAAKPVIDLLVQVSSLEETREQIVPILAAEGYDYFWRTDVSPAYAWFIKRDSEGKRTHHIHMVEADSKLWERLYFRDYLREFPEEAKRYAELKQFLSEKYPNDRVAYTEGKAEYVRAITERAKSRYGAT